MLSLFPSCNPARWRMGNHYFFFFCLPTELQLFAVCGFHRCENQVLKKTDLKTNEQKNLAVPQSAHNFLQMTELGVQTEDTLQCSGTERLLKNDLPKGNFAKSPNPKLKPGEVPVL